MVIEIVVICILVFFVALYSKAWSLGGVGIGVNEWFTVAIGVLLIAGALIGYYSYEAISITLTVMSLIFGSIGVAICVN